MPRSTLEVMSARLWPLCMMLRSCSGLISNSLSTLSSISRCWAVTQTMLSSSGLRLSSRTSGAIFIASGRVPNTDMTLSLVIFLLQGFTGGGVHGRVVFVAP